MIYPEWWPPGCDEQRVRECNCDTCEAMIEGLESYRQEKSTDGTHAPLTAFQ